MKTKNKINTIYEVHTTKKFKKNLKKISKQGKDLTKLEDIVIKLANKEPLDPKYKNHNLVNDKYYKNCGECHIEPDWILIYRYSKNELILLLVNTGSHSEILNI